MYSFPSVPIGSDALSQFGEDFFYSLDKKVSKCQRNRDRAVKQRADLKEEQEKLEKELRNLLDEQELKYKEHFVDTSRTQINVDVSIVKTSRNEDKQTTSKKEGNVTKTDHSSFENDVNNESMVDSSPGQKSKVKNSKSMKKWNDDVWCPPTFDNMDFIYKTDEGSPDIKEENDNMEAVTSELRTLSCTPLETERLEDMNSLDVLPPVGQAKQMKKTKPKRNYTPNLVVANRTLQLRRSNSSSKLNEAQEKIDKTLQESENQDDSDQAVFKTLRSRSRSGERKPHIPQKPPFR